MNKKYFNLNDTDKRVRDIIDNNTDEDSYASYKVMANDLLGIINGYMTINQYKDILRKLKD